MRSTYKDGMSFIFRGWSAARLAGEHPPKSAPVVISSLYLERFLVMAVFRCFDDKSVPKFQKSQKTVL